VPIVNLSPITLATYATLNAEFVKDNAQHTAKAKLLFRGLMTPGEIIRPYLPRKGPLVNLKPPQSNKKFGGQGPNVSDPSNN
jgi:hypothetical protein